MPRKKKQVGRPLHPDWLATGQPRQWMDEKRGKPENGACGWPDGCPQEAKIGVTGLKGTNGCFSRRDGAGDVHAIHSYDWLCDNGDVNLGLVLQGDA